jgi:hypothetical protein
MLPREDIVESKLEQAARHVLAGRRIIEAQRLNVAAKQRRGDDATISEGLLRTFEESQMIFETDLEELRTGRR